MGEMTRKELAAMTDQELLAYEREPVGGRAVTELLAKGYRLPSAKVIGGGLPGHGKRA
jgi:hypothetical protein